LRVSRETEHDTSKHQRVAKLEAVSHVLLHLRRCLVGFSVYRQRHYVCSVSIVVGRESIFAFWYRRALLLYYRASDSHYYSSARALSSSDLRATRAGVDHRAFPFGCRRSSFVATSPMKSPSIALEPSATALSFDPNMKFDRRHCISESPSSGRGSALDR
jgi:hypothetical protein